MQRNKKIKNEELMVDNQERIQGFNQELAKQVEYEIAQRMFSDYFSNYLFESSLNPIVIIRDEDFKVIKSNSGALEIFGKEIVGLDFIELFSDKKNKESILEGIYKARESKKRQSFKMQLIGKNNQSLSVIVSISLFYYMQKVDLCFTFVDISDIVNLEKELNDKRAMLAQKSKMEEMGKMLGNIAHQWKQPLNALYLLCQNFKEMNKFGEINAENIEKYINTMLGQIQFMSKTIEEFREFYNPSKAKEEVCVYQEIKNILELFYRLVDKGISIELSSKDEKMQIFASKNEFWQIIIVLIDNALEAIKARIQKGEIKEGNIEITCQNKQGMCIIKVGDNGGGICAEVANRIFETYFTTKENGNGIGLSMVKMILEKMRGDITFANHKEGVEFEVKIPLHRG